MIVKNIEVTNKEVLNILKNAQSKDFIQGTMSFAKGFEEKDYDIALHTAVDNETLFNHLRHNEPIPKLKYNKILGDTEAGLYFHHNIQKFLEFDEFYTSGYIPKGFDRWHSDSDVSGHAILFSYSENGNGYFKYRDPELNDVFISKDIKGWMVRGMYYGVTQDTMLWHCVESSCFRITFILIFKSPDKYSKAIELLTRE